MSIYQKNAVLTLSNHISKLVPTAKIKTDSLETIVNSFTSTQQNIVASSNDFLKYISDDLINDFIDDISYFIISEFQLEKNKAVPLIKDLFKDNIREVLSDKTASVDNLRHKIQSSSTQLSAGIQLIMSDDLMDFFSGGVDTSKIDNIVAKKIDKFMPTQNGDILGSIHSSVIDLVEKRVNVFVSNIGDKNLQNVANTLLSTVKSGQINPQDISKTITDGLKSIDTNAFNFVEKWIGLTSVIDDILDPNKTVDYKDSLTYKSTQNILKQLKIEYDRAVKQNAIDIQLENKNIGFRDPLGEFPPNKNNLDPFNSSFQVLDAIASAMPAWTSASGNKISEPTTTKNSDPNFNSKNVSESGHIHEIDDTPNHERILVQHKSGTKKEIDAVGNETKKIIGDKYTIVHKNGYVYVEGECDVVVNGAMNVKTSNCMNVQVVGDANINVHGNAVVGVGGDADLSIGGRFSLNADEIMLFSHNNIKLKAANNIITESSNDTSFKAGKNILLDAKLDVSSKSGKNILLDAKNSLHAKGSVDISLKANRISNNSAGDFVIKSGDFFIAGATGNIKASGNLNLDGAFSYWQSGTAQSKSTINTLDGLDGKLTDISFGKFELEKMQTSQPFVESKKAPTMFDIISTGDSE